MTTEDHKAFGSSDNSLQADNHLCSMKDAKNVLIITNGCQSSAYQLMGNGAGTVMSHMKQIICDG